MALRQLYLIFLRPVDLPQCGHGAIPVTPPTPVGVDRSAAARPGMAGRAGRPTRSPLPARDRGRDLLSARQRRQIGVRCPRTFHPGPPSTTTSPPGMRSVSPSSCWTDYGIGWLREGRRAQPTAAIIDSQSVKAAETVGVASRRYDAGSRHDRRPRSPMTTWETSSAGVRSLAPVFISYRISDGSDLATRVAWALRPPGKAAHLPYEGCRSGRCDRHAERTGGPRADRFGTGRRRQPRGGSQSSGAAST
jgi:hypothetical protein